MAKATSIAFVIRKPHWLPDNATLIELESLDNYSFPFMHQVKIHFHWGEAQPQPKLALLQINC
jgi:hypothetical protein